MPLPQDERIARLCLARTDGVGPVTFRRLIDRFTTARRALEALPAMARRGGRAQPLKPPTLAQGQRGIEAIEAAGANWLVYGDDDYPALLAATEDAPVTLTYKGNVALLAKPCIAIVGARNASLQGRRMAETLAADLGRAGLVVASGLARGIDTAAHTASLATGTIAVVAGGVDVVYPQENAALYETIARDGCIVAENPLGTQPTNQHFPRRNRIISGLAQGTVVVEATLKSGSLITAHIAADQGREVFAVPGHPFDPRAGGPNALIRDGATLVTGAADVLEVLASLKSRRIVAETAHLPVDFPTEPDAQTLDDAREALLDLLGSMPVGVDDLIRETGIPTAIVAIALLELELAGRIARHPQNRVSAPFFDGGMDTDAVLM